MTDPAAEEIERIVADAQAGVSPSGDDNEEDDDASDDAPQEAPPKRRVVKTKKTKNGGGSAKAKLMEELDAETLLDGVVLPKPSENVKTLGDMYAKYGVGDNPDFKVQVWRSFPKIAPGGKKFDGYYDTYDMPLDLDTIASEYGGGQYRIVIVGPHPSNPRLPKHYDSLPVPLPGDPKWERLPRASQSAAKESDSDGSGVQMPQMPQYENPKLSEQAMKIVAGVADHEREERRRVEARSVRDREESRSFLGPAVDAERRRADDLILSERSKSESERRFLEERISEERQRLVEERQSREEMRQRMESIERSRPSAAQELRELVPLLQKDDSTAREMLTQVLEKHRSEVTAVQQQNTVFIESIRTGHQSEVASMRDAHRREIEAEREASRSRESRTEERLNSEREERRRDQERFRQTLEERDRQWQDRLTQAKEMVEQSWQARHNTLMSSAETRNQYLQTELDRAKQEIADLRNKREESGDPLMQIHKMVEMQTAIKTLTGDENKGSSQGGGIGITGADGDWKQTAIQEGFERAPDLIEKIGDLFSGRRNASSQQQQPQHFPGQEVDTPNGKMVVVVAPDGSLALTPKEAFEAAQRQSGGRLLQQPQRPKPRVMPDVDEMGEQSQRKSRWSAVPNLAEGLPKQKPPWEGGSAEQPTQSPQQRRDVTRGPRMTSRSTQQPVADEPLQLSGQQRQALNVIAKAVHDSVMQADEPEEFVARMMQEYPPPVLKQIAGYTTADILTGIVQVQPASAGATPAGQQFVRAAFRQLRQALRE